MNDSVVLLMFSGAAVFQHLTRALTETIKGLIEMAKQKIQQNFFEGHRDKIGRGGPDDCWLWTAYRHRQGYGVVRIGRKVRLAHRAAYEAVHGKGSAEGLVVRHRCDTPACVNPGHLELGTQADNVRDRDERERRVAPNGERHGMAKLTEADVREIRATYVRGSSDLGQYALARRFGVAQTLIGNIVRREGWAHVA